MGEIPLRSRRVLADFEREARQRVADFQGVMGGPPDPPPLPPEAAALVFARLAYGPRPGDIEAFNALGATDAQRLEAWLDLQLNPAAIDDSACDARLAESKFATLGLSITELWSRINWDPNTPPYEATEAIYETRYATFIRGSFSKRQVFERLVEFWHNHFSVDSAVHPLNWIMPSYDAVIRAHALGNFRALLEAVARTTAMLIYLDNYKNSKQDANENYGRELMELHTLGIDAFYPEATQATVPRDGNGLPCGYTEEDVIAAAKCLTGWTFEGFSNELPTTGAFRYHGPWHDPGPKTVVGLSLPANQPDLKDGQDLFDHLVRHPATARFIAKKLCRRLLADEPPQVVVDLAAATFAAHIESPDQIARVVRAIATTPQFLLTWGEKIKRPFEIVLGYLRGAEGDLPFTYTLPVPEPTSFDFIYRFGLTGMPLYGWPTPDGFPDRKEVWSATGPLVACWSLINVLTFGAETDFPGRTPPGVTTARQIVDFWCYRLLGRPPDASDKEPLMTFMAAGAGFDVPLPVATDEGVRARIKLLATLIGMTPSFLWR